MGGWLQGHDTPHHEPRQRDNQRQANLEFPFRLLGLSGCVKAEAFLDDQQPRDRFLVAVEIIAFWIGCHGSCVGAEA
jgi:hypothetical protein